MLTGVLTTLFERQAGGAPESFADALCEMLMPPDRALPVPSALDRATWDAGTGIADRLTTADVADPEFTQDRRR
ncbi:hypothetical protein [Microbacterium deminutum]|uniref:Uncharacterized protein n=1 Tax=Microbacterium deminutum TaxID=344164 RepID=A0ABN2R3A2_9MICO